MGEPRRATIIESLQSPKMLGGLPCFRDLSTWGRWLVFVKAVYGLPMSADEERIFCQHTGRSRYAPPPGGFPESVAIVGRQAGKDRIGSAIQSHEAISAEAQADGTELYSFSIAQDARASLRTAFRYAIAPFEAVPAFGQFVAQKRAGAWTLRNQVVLANYPCTPESVRGIRACVAICTELAFFRSAENVPVDVEMLRALRPCLATTRGKLVMLSSPYGQSGALWDLHRQHYGRDVSDTLVWQASAPEMNPTLPADYLLRMERDDPEAYRSEVLGEFRAGLSTFLDPDALAACVDSEVRERPRSPGTRTLWFWDSASGTGKDKFVVAGAHYDQARQCVLLDVVRSWSPPFNPSGVIAEVADLMKASGESDAEGDRYAPGFVLEQARAHGITYRFSEWDRSRLYLELLPLVNAGQVRLLDVPELLRELRGLERRRGASGRDRIDHPSGQHDDVANACAGALVLASREGCRPAFDISGGGANGLSEIEEQSAIGTQAILSVTGRLGSWFPGDGSY